MQEELQYHIKQNQTAIEQELKDIMEAVQSLQTNITNNTWQAITVTDWTEGFVARDVAHIGSLLARHRALCEALHIVGKTEKVEA